MTVQEIRKVRWIKADWENMKVLACNTGIITLGMVETFVEGVCNSLARDFDNVEEEMIELVKENNKEFYKMVDRCICSTPLCYRDGIGYGCFCKAESC